MLIERRTEELEKLLEEQLQALRSGKLRRRTFFFLKVLTTYYKAGTK